MSLNDRGGAAAGGESATLAAEIAADQHGAQSDPENVQQGCRGWIAVRSRYAEFDLIAVGGRITISRIRNGAATQVAQETVDYTTIPTNGLFVSRAPAPRPPQGQQGAAAGGAAGAAVAGTETASTATSQAQIASVASGNGNPLVLMGGDAGFEPGRYRVTFRPEIRHGKLRIDPRPVSRAANAAMNGRYPIIAPDGTRPDGAAVPYSNANTTDRYLQVPLATAVNAEWSQEVTVGCAPRNTPVLAEFIWTDFRAHNDRTTERLRTLHPDARHDFLSFINKIEELNGTRYTVTDGFRTPAEQDALYCSDFMQNRNGRPQTTKRQYCQAQGFTGGRGPWKSNARQWQSNHNYGIAIDMYDLSSGQLVAVTNTNGNLASHFGLTWGRSFGDPPHFEKTNPDWHDLRDRRAAHTLTYDGRDYVEFP